MDATRHHITLNGEPRAISARTLEDMLSELGFGGQKVATAVNGDFVPAGKRATLRISEGDKIEVVSPRQGG